MALEPDNAPAERPGADALLSAIAAFLIFALCAGGFALWDRDGIRLLPAFSYSAVFALCILIPALIRKIRTSKGAPLLGALAKGSLSPLGFGIGLLLVFCSDWLTRDYSFFQGPSVRGELLLLGLLWLFVMRKASPAGWCLFAIASCLLLGSSFLLQSGGRPLFSDDNATFIYRLSLLKEAFPRIPLYYPLWNGGIDARDFFATGALNVFLLASPLVYLGPLWHSYNWIIASVLFLLLPLSVFAGARMEKVSLRAASISVLTAVASGLVWYRWALKYGTLGFITTAALLPLNLSLAAKILDPERDVSPMEAVLAILSISLMLLWSPSAIVFLPAALLAVCRLRALLRKRYVLLIAAGLLLINVPWMTLFWSVSEVGSFLKSEKAAHQIEVRQDGSVQQNTAKPKDYRHGRGGKISLKKSLRVLRESALATNPLILFLAWPGLLMLRVNTRRLLYLTVPWLLFLGTIVVPLKPQLEFDRMLLLLSLYLCIPAGLALEALFERAGQDWRYKVVGALAGGFVLCGPLSACFVLENRSFEQFHFAEPVVESLAETLKTQGGEGRTLFTGFVLHELSFGHLAPLAVLAGRPLVASSPFHNLWRYTQVLPKSFISRGEAGLEDFMRLYNVSSVVAHEPDWRERLLSNPAKFERVAKDERWLVFKVRDFENNWFLEGRGELLDQSAAGVKMRIDSGDAVIKFTYFPHLTASGCTIGPFAAAPEIKFIKLSGCPPGAEVLVRSESPWRRLLKAWRHD